jgi:hypothetical protein
MSERIPAHDIRRLDALPFTDLPEVPSVESFTVLTSLIPAEAV